MAVRAVRATAVIYRGKNHSHIDVAIPQGRGYAFRVEALDSRGRTIARSNVAPVKIPTLPVEALKLDCKVVDLPWAAAQDVVRPIPADRHAVACESSKSGAPDFAGYRLFRAAREGHCTGYPFGSPFFFFFFFFFFNYDQPDGREVIYRGDAQRSPCHAT